MPQRQTNPRAQVPRSQVSLLSPRHTSLFQASAPAPPGERDEQKQKVGLGLRAVAQGGRSRARARHTRSGLVREGELPGPGFREAQRAPRNGVPVCARAHRQTQRVLSKSAFHVFYKFLRIQSEHFLKRTVGSCAYAPGKARPRRFPAPHGTGRGLQTWAHPPQAAPLEASPSSPQPHGHQLSTYLLSESGSWPGTPSAEPPRRFPVIRRSTSTAAQGACPSGSRRGAHRAPDTPPGALALRREPLRKAQACTGLAGAGPWRGAPRELQLEAEGLLPLRAPRAPDAGQPLTPTPDGRAGRLHTAPTARRALGKPP